MKTKIFQCTHEFCLARFSLYHETIRADQPDPTKYFGDPSWCPFCRSPIIEDKEPQLDD